MRSVALHCGVSYVSQEIALGHGTYEEMWTFENGLSWNHSGLELNKLRTGVLSRAGEGVSRQERHRADSVVTCLRDVQSQESKEALHRVPEQVIPQTEDGQS